jgi:5-methylcytosine-specific restriction endonuclease McrA
MPLEQLLSGRRQRGHLKRRLMENLQLLCPNCHSQTENFAGRNVHRIKDLGP